MHFLATLVIAIAIGLIVLFYLFTFFTMNVIERGLSTIIVWMIAFTVITNLSHGHTGPTGSQHPTEIPLWIRALPFAFPIGMETLRAVTTHVIGPLLRRRNANAST